MSTQFFFGDSISLEDQKDYLDAHHILYNDEFTEFTLTSESTDFQYMVQIGNRGTWSQGDVEVIARKSPPRRGQPVHRELRRLRGADPDDLLRNGIPVFAAVNLDAASGWNGAATSELGAGGYGTIETTSGTAPTAFWLDSQNSPGGISISHTFQDDNGGTNQLSFDIAVQDLVYQSVAYATANNASIEFRIDGVAVASLSYAEVLAGAGGANDMFHVEELFSVVAGQHTLSIVDTSPDAAFTGFAIDSIQINDWLI